MIAGEKRRPPGGEHGKAREVNGNNWKEAQGLVNYVGRGELSMPGYKGLRDIYFSEKSSMKIFGWNFNLKKKNPWLHFHCSFSLIATQVHQDGWMDKSMDEWMDGWINRWMNEWIKGWMMGGVTAENIPNLHWVSGWKKMLIFCFLVLFCKVCWYNSHEKYS